MTKEEPEQPQEDVPVPDDVVTDLEPSEDEADDVSGGTFKQGWPTKWTGAS
jgi:hypothetical protein